MDEVRIYNRALSAGEIKSIYDAGSAGMIKPQINLVLFEPGGTDRTVIINGVVTAQGADVVRLNWDWGDGTSNDSFFNAMHTYSGDGTFTVTVTAVDSQGGTISKTTVVVLPLPGPRNIELVVFELEVNGLEVTVNGVVTVVGEIITMVNWDWGDGASNESLFPARPTYGTNGSHAITATAFDRLGRTATKTVNVNLPPPPRVLAVTKTTDIDHGACDADCSLREAIAATNFGDTIVIPAGTYTLTLGAELSIDKDLALNGDGADTTIIQAATGSGIANFRVFNITGGNVAISGVTIRHGSATAGGGIVNGGTLTITNSTVSSNTATSEGGGIFNGGMLTLMNSTVSGNDARIGGGIWNNWGRTLTLTDSTVSGNDARIGGGIYNAGPAEFTRSTVSGNTSDGIRNNRMLTMVNSTVSGHRGTGIFNLDTGTLSLTNTTINGHTGAAIINNGTATLNNTTVSGKSAVDGIIFTNAGSTLTLTNSIIANSGGGGDCSGAGTLISHGHNLDSDGTCVLNSTGDRSNTDPLLDPLQDNGGPTFTHACWSAARPLTPVTTARPRRRTSAALAAPWAPPAISGLMSSSPQLPPSSPSPEVSSRLSGRTLGKSPAVPCPGSSLMSYPESTEGRPWGQPLKKPAGAPLNLG